MYVVHRIRNIYPHFVNKKWIRLSKLCEKKSRKTAVLRNIFLDGNNHSPYNIVVILRT